MRTVLLALVLATAALANIAYTNHATAVSNGAASSGTVSIAVTAASGDFLVVSLGTGASGGCYDGNMFPVISDGTATYTERDKWHTGSTGGLWMYYGFASTSNPTITATFYSDSGHSTPTNCANRSIAVDTFGGVNTTTPTDGSAAHGSATNTGPSSGNVTASQTGSVLVCSYYATSSGRTFTDSTITIAASANTTRTIATGHLMSGTGTHACTATLDVSSSWIAIGAAFQPQSYASSGGIRHKVTQ